MELVERYTEAAFVLAVVGAALIYPPLALIVGAAFLVGLAVTHYRMIPPTVVEEDSE